MLELGVTGKSISKGIRDGSTDTGTASSVS
jgi:hypothetical protein